MTINPFLNLVAQTIDTKRHISFLCRPTLFVFRPMRGFPILPDVSSLPAIAAPRSRLLPMAAVIGRFGHQNGLETNLCDKQRMSCR
jgi:hypothetical protein